MSCKEIQAQLSAFVDGRLSPEDQSRLTGHLDGCSPCAELRAGWERDDKLLYAAFSDHPFGDEAVEQILLALPPAGNRSQPRWGRPVSTGVAAAAAVLLLALGVQLLGENSDSPVAIQSQETRKQEPIAKAAPGFALRSPGGKARLGGGVVHEGDTLRAEGQAARLEFYDGSRVEVRARSEIRLVKDRDGGDTIVLGPGAGSVFCHVAKRTHPFRVQAGQLLVEVLGTRFVVDRDAQTARVTVIDGRVLVTRDERRHRLGPGDQAVSRREQSSLGLSRVVPRRFGLWVGELRAEQEELDLQSEAGSRPGPLPTTQQSPPAEPPLRPPVEAPDSGLDNPVLPPGAKAKD